MKNKILTLLLLFGGTCMMKAQLTTTEAIQNAINNEQLQINELNKQIEELKAQFEQLSWPMHNMKRKIGNKLIHYFAEENFKKGNFQIADTSNGIFTTDEIAHLYAKEYNQENTFHLLCHGLSDAYLSPKSTIVIGGKELTAKEVSELITGSLQGYERMITKPFAIVLHACKSGLSVGKEDSFAEQLSTILTELNPNIAVIAAPDAIYPSKDMTHYREIIAPTRAHAGRPNFAGERWQVFKGGKIVSNLGTPDYKETIVNFQNTKK